ncbi:MAG TPA: TIGR04283 family arsenosugar biosynthesis glycosyltransferase [Balneolaceae bacterium]
MRLSIIIPTYNEVEVIEKTIAKIRSEANTLEVIVVDGGSLDSTVKRAENAGATVITSPEKGRAAQMNFGAKHAKGDILYFLHADSLPPAGFAVQIKQAILSGHQAGCFQLSFDENHFLLKTYAWFTRFDVDAFRFGDQSLFITRSAFFEINGFSDDHIVMEDQEIVKRIKDKFSFTVLDETIVTSARKYRQVGFLKLQLIFVLIFMLYKLGINQRKLIIIYQKLVQ